MAELLTQKKLAEWLDVVPRTIHNLVKEGMPSSLQSGKRVYPWPACLHWYVEYKVNLAAGGADEADVQAAMEAKLREAIARADKLEAEAATAQLALAERRGQLVTLDFMAGELERVLTNLRGGLLNFPGRWAPELIARDDVRAVRAVLDPAIDELMKTLTLAADDDEEDPVRDALDGPTAEDEEGGSPDAGDPDRGPDADPDAGA